MKILGVVIACVMMTGSFSACEVSDVNTAETKQTTATNQALSQMNQQIGMPAITNFQEKKLLKHIYELRDKSNLICYYYYQNEMTGKLEYQGRCLGFGLPYSTEFTNPQKVDYYSTGSVSLPQADPNGLYAPSSANATWIIAVDDNGNQHVEYAEPNLVVSESKKPKRLCDPTTLPTDY